MRRYQRDSPEPVLGRDTLYFSLLSVSPCFPGVHLNPSLLGTGVSAGGRGGHVGMTARGQKYVSAELPGTGLSVRQYSPMSSLQRDSTPRMGFWPLVIAAIIRARLFFGLWS